MVDDSPKDRTVIYHLLKFEGKILEYQVDVVYFISYKVEEIFVSTASYLSHLSAWSSSKILASCWLMENITKSMTPTKNGLLQTEELYKYLLETSVYPREPEPLKEIRAITASHPRAFMGMAPDAGQLMTMLLDLVNANKTIEIGVFTGYSLLLTALSIPDDGKIIAIDTNREWYEIGLPIIKKANVEHKIDFIESQALPVLDKLLEDHENEGSFDFAFVDADKDNYKNYHERVIKLLRVGGIVVYDNTLRSGTVALPEELVSDYFKSSRQSMIDLTKTLTADPRIQISHAPLGDGIMICKRLF